MAQSKRKTAQCQTLDSYFSFKRRKPEEEEIATDTQDEPSCSRKKVVDGQEEAAREAGSHFTETLSK